MQQAQAHAEDLRFDTERRLICKGSALVRFEYLKWNGATERPDPEHVEHVKRIFRKEGCRPLAVGHHILAVVDQRRLDAALEGARQRGRWTTDGLPSSYATIDTQDGYPELDFPGGIECLHGRHRVQAGREWLPPTEKWWIVDLYLSGISYELKTLLIEEYANEERPCDGEIYRKIREYQFLPGSIDSNVSPATCISFENRWWARFNPSREKKLRSLFRNPMLAAGFDALGKSPGIFDAGMMVTTLHKMIATSCHEEIQHYLSGHTGDAWDGFLKGIEKGLQRLDKVTVNAVELRAPGVSTIDAQFLRGQVLGGAIFSGFSAQERGTIWGNIASFRGIIPSLSKFFRDINFLEACVDAVKWLVTVPPGGTVFTALGRYYTRKEESQRVQTTETTFQPKTGSPTYCKRLGYLQLFAFAMRHHQSLPKAPVKKNLKTIPRVKADREILQRFACLAAELGFNTPEVQVLKGSLNPLLILDTQESVPLLVTTGPGESIKHRCGLPHTDTFETDRKYLFLHNLCEERDETSEGVTSFFVLKSWFAAFFNPPRWTRSVVSTESPHPPLPQAAHQHVHGGDVDMEPPSPDQREHMHEQQQIMPGQDVQRTDMEQIQETIQSVQESMSWSAKEANRRLEMEQETNPYPSELFVPRDAATTETRNTTTIRFVEGDGKGSDKLNTLQEYVEVVLELRVDHGDPTSLVEQQVLDFLHKGKRTCDRYNRYLSPEECYSVATREENRNTLFLLPNVALQREAEGQGYQVPDEWDQAMESLGNHEVPQENTQEPGGGLQETKGLENHGVHLQQTQEGENDDVWDQVLDQEKENAAHAYILDRNTTIIYLKKRVGDSHDVSKPAKDWEWTDVGTLEVPIDDPHGIVEQRIGLFWEKRNLKPHDSFLRRLQDKDCYRAAVEDEDNTLYLMVPSPQTEEENAAERTWIPPPPLPPNAFDLGEEHKRRVYASPQAQEEIDWKSSTFVFPSHIPLLPSQQEQLRSPAGFLWQPPLPPPSKQQLPLVEAIPEAHRDKIGRGRKNKVGMSFQEESVRIRKGPGTMRHPKEDQPKRSGQNRKLVKPRNHKKGTTPDNEMADGDFEDKIY